jgi:hypothetical protein
VLWGIFGPKKEEVTGWWRKLRNEELHDLYSSPSIIRIMKPKRMGWAKGGEEKRESVIGRKPRVKKTTRKTKKQMDG